MRTLPFDALAETSTVSPLLADFAAMVRHGLALPQKKLEPVYFYDSLGSALFDAITRLPEYTITRAELELLGSCGHEILHTMGGAPELVELGPGNGEKLERLLAAGSCETRAHLIDISPAALETAAKRLREQVGHEITTFAGTFEEGLAALQPSEQRRIVLFLGSNLGNLTMQEAAAFLRSVRSRLAPGDGLLLGVDLIKDEPALLAAYDDPLGVTAAFNKNLLVRMNRELGANFDLLGFDHRALWNPDASRVEMHLVSVVDQGVSLASIEQHVTFRAGETIWTESSHKYEVAGIRALVERAGFSAHGMWMHDGHRFLEVLCIVPG
jgi:L-histidine N-alpha-methyltransferase